MKKMQYSSLVPLRQSLLSAPPKPGLGMAIENALRPVLLKCDYFT